MSSILRAFHHRNYRLYWSGFALSLTGTWMQTLAQSWLVWRLTESPLWLGIIGAMPQLPSLLLGSVGGVLVDRAPKRGVLLVTQIGMAACALILGILTLSETVTAMHVLILSAVSGIFMAVDAPARLSFVTELVGKEDLGNAIALNASTFNAARLIGPTIAGVIVPFFGEGVCFMLNAASYFALIIGLMSMRNLPPSVPSSADPLFKQLRDAYHYIGDSPVHRLLIRNVIAFAIFGFSYTTLLPIFADRILHSDAAGLGMLMGAGGIGALAGGIWQASLSRETKRGPMVMGGSLGLGIGILLFGFSNQFEVSLVALAITGFSGIVMLTSTNTLLQSLTPDHLRGRVLGFYTSSFLGFLPVGSFIAGAAADYIGAPRTMLLSAVICIGVSVYIIVHYRRLRVV